LAVSALDQIYGQFAPASLTAPSTVSLEHDEGEALMGSAQLPLSKDVALLLENLLRFYDELSKETDDGQSVAIKSITANRRVGDIRRRLGEYEEARKTYERAVQRIEELEPRLRNSPPVRIEFARIKNGLGIVLQESHLASDAVNAHGQAIARLDVHSDSSEERLELARSLYLLHLALPRDRRQEAHEASVPEQEHIERAIAILTDLRSARPADPDPQFLLARCLLVRSSCHSDGSLNESQSQAVAMLEGLVKDSPEVADYRYELGDAYRSIEWREFRRRGDAPRPAEELSQSESRLRRALAVTSDLETKHPNIPQYTVLQKMLHHLLANVLRDQQELGEAELELQRAIEKQLVVVQQSREPPHQQVWLLHAQLKRAQLLRDLGRDAESRLGLEHIVAGFERLQTLPEIKADRNSRRWTEKFLARSYATLACVLNRLGEKEEADLVLRKAERPDA
jgi:tetratricopeptide (TPR) repeat protein